MLALLTLCSLPQGAAALGTAFTYQGQLQQSGSPATGPCDFQFMLFDAAGSGSPPTGGNQIGNPAAADGVQVSNGLFTLPLDFGAAAFSTGSDRWLQIAVRCPAGSGSYQTLAPRQPVTPAPFALFASTVADGSVSSAKLAAGAVTTSQLATNAVTSAQIADGTITMNDLADAAVSTTKIGDGQVTAAKLAAPLRLTGTVAHSFVGVFDGISTGLNSVGVSGTANNGTTAYGLYGVAAAGFGVVGSSTSGTGVFGESTNSDGVTGSSLNNGVGVRGMSRGNDGVYGQSTLSNNGYGVHGVAQSGADARGVFGESTYGTGVYGSSINSTGVIGSGGTIGVFGVPLQSDGAGVVGYSYTNSGQDSPNASGVFGAAESGVGVRGVSNTGTGVHGKTGVASSFTLAGVVGECTGNNGIGVSGVANTGINAWAVYGESTAGYAGYFKGRVNVTGTVAAGGKTFKIDHPFDPANKYLMHAAVESPDMKNIYDGIAVLDDAGEAVVELPVWFEALNRDFRYQLTCIGGVAPVYIAEEVSDHHFRIAGGTHGLKVSWLVTGIRKDAFANAHPLVVEPDKPAEERGRYLYPVEAGMPASLSVDRAKEAVAQAQVQ